MSSQHYQLDVTKTDGVSRYTGAEINQVHGIIDSQLNGALQMLGVGVQSGTSFAVSAGSGLNASISAGSAVVEHSAYGGIFLQTAIASTLALPASSTVYVFVLAKVDGSTTDSRTTGTPIFSYQNTNTLDGGLLLAQVTTSGSAVTSVADMRALESNTAIDMFDQDNATTVGLTWGYKAGRIRNGTTITQIAAGTLALTGSATNYVEVDPVGATISTNTSGFTAGRIPVRQIVTNSTAITASTDERSWFATVTPSGVAGGDLTGSYPNPTIKASVGLTGAPTAPTAAADTNTTQLATTAFVVAQAGSGTPVGDGTAAAGTSLRYSRQDHVHPTDTSRAADSAVVHNTGAENVAGVKTFSSSPLVPTPSPGDNSTKAASTAFVAAAVGADGALLAANNLSDVASAATARSNLGAVGGSGTSGRIPAWTGSAALGDSAIDMSNNAANIGPRSADSGKPGQVRLRDDTGTARWMMGISGAAAATLWGLYDLVAAAFRIVCDSAGRVAIGGSTPNASAALDLQSTTGGLLPNRLTTTQRDAISSPATGLLVYNSTTAQHEWYNGSAWVALGGGGGSTFDVDTVLTDKFGNTMADNAGNLLTV